MLSETNRWLVLLRRVPVLEELREHQEVFSQTSATLEDYSGCGLVYSSSISLNSMKILLYTQVEVQQ